MTDAYYRAIRTGTLPKEDDSDEMALLPLFSDICDDPEALAEAFKKARVYLRASTKYCREQREDIDRQNKTISAQNEKIADLERQLQIAQLGKNVVDMKNRELRANVVALEQELDVSLSEFEVKIIENKELQDKVQALEKKVKKPTAKETKSKEDDVLLYEAQIQALTDKLTIAENALAAKEQQMMDVFTGKDALGAYFVKLSPEYKRLETQLEIANAHCEACETLCSVGLAVDCVKFERLLTKKNKALTEELADKKQAIDVRERQNADFVKHALNFNEKGRKVLKAGTEVDVLRNFIRGFVEKFEFYAKLKAQHGLP